MTNNLPTKPQFLISDEVISSVRESLALSPYKMEVEGKALTKIIEKTIIVSLKNLFTSIGTDLVDENDSCAVTLNGKFTKSILDGILFRVIVEKQFVDTFSEYLYKDLITQALNGSLNTEFYKLSLVGNELVLLGTENSKLYTEYDWTKEKETNLETV